MTECLSVVLIGPMPPPLGGTTVSFQALAGALAGRGDLSVDVLDSGGIRGRGLAGAVCLVRLLWQLARRIPRADVVALNVATTGLAALGPPVAALARAAGAPLVVRKFAGTEISSFDPVRRFAMLWTLRRASLYLAQTKALMDSATAMGLTNARWLPNSRPMPPLPDDAPGGRRCTRFVYLGQIRRPKGIYELIDAGERLSGDVSVDVYGPLGYDVPESAFVGLERVRYAGVLEPERVPGALEQYDALVLPSYREGYAGVVLEAYGAGLPVVTTRTAPLTEIVDDTTGVLIAPRDADALYDAMSRLVDDPGLYTRLRRGVRERRDEFSDTTWHERFVEFCLEAARGR